MEILSPPGKSTRRADASPRCGSRLTAEPDSALALAGKLFLLAWLLPPPWLRALFSSCRALCGIARHAEDRLMEMQLPPNAKSISGKRFIRWLPGHCGACRSRAQPWDCEPARCLSFCPPSPAHPEPPAALTSRSCSVKATLQKEKCCQGWRRDGGCMLQMPLFCSQGCQAPREVGSQVPLVWTATLVQWKRRKVQSLNCAVPWDPPVL